MVKLIASTLIILAWFGLAGVAASALPGPAAVIAMGIGAVLGSILLGALCRAA